MSTSPSKTASHTGDETPAKDYNSMDLATFNGKELPADFVDVEDCYIVRGIRHHENFARSTEVTQLCLEGGREFARVAMRVSL